MSTPQLNELIWQVLAAIPPGTVTTYGQIAKQCGFPNHARYVGNTLKKLPKSTALPWHRVVNARGEISFPRDTPAYARQRVLLEDEGLIFINGRLPLKTYAWTG